MKEGDDMANLMYYAWIRHGVKPSEIYAMSKGELKVLKAFYIIETAPRNRR